MKTDVVKLVTFRLGDDLFAADVTAVERVLRYAVPNAVPDAPAWVAGVIEHRGKVIPVVDLRRRIELENTAITPTTRILVLSSADGWVGTIVDAVLEVVNVPVTSVTPPPTLFRGLGSEFLRGIAKVKDRLIVILEVDRVLASADRIVLERALQSAESASNG
ncbi:MAG: chemotaxis protein CheW [Gemmatimonadaceae bacterium]